MVIGRDIYVSILLPDESQFHILAKVDTGAYSSSIDSDVFDRLNLIVNKVKTKTVKNVLGKEYRDIFPVEMLVKGFKIESELNVFSRSDMKYKMIVGRKDILKLNAVVDVRVKEKKNKKRKI